MNIYPAQIPDVYIIEPTVFGDNRGFFFESYAENKKQIWIPPGFAHGFLVLSDAAEFIYKTTDFYAPTHERCILWNDPDLRIQWPTSGHPLVSTKDEKGVLFNDAEVFT